MEFHGIPWNCSCQRNWRISSSMEFHGTSRVSEIGVLQVPWNSMELFVSAKLAHSKFHTARVIEIGAPKVPWNSMEFHGTALVIEIGTLLVPWNSMEFHGTSRVSEIGALQVQWNSMEFHGTARVSEIDALQVPWNSMELLVSAKLAHFKFHGIPWNCSCQRNWRTTGSMEFPGTSRVSEIGALLVPWNSMEFHATSRAAKLAHLKFHGIPCSCQRNWRILSSMELFVSAILAHS